MPITPNMSHTAKQTTKAQVVTARATIVLRFDWTSARPVAAVTVPVCIALSPQSASVGAENATSNNSCIDQDQPFSSYSTAIAAILLLSIPPLIDACGQTVFCPDFD
jgi:hypothetical protein